jgi:CHASE3 domain sensor protein
MDLSTAEDSAIVRIGFGLALVVICLAIGFRFALNRSLTKVSNSLIGGFLILDHVDNILDDLDRLSLNQRAFLSTGDERFSQDVVESVMGIERQIDSLQQIARKGARLHAPVNQLARAIDWALDSLGRSNELEQTSGAAVAIALLDNDESIEDAKEVAQELRRQATDGVFDRVRTERKIKSILDVLF